MPIQLLDLPEELILRIVQCVAEADNQEDGFGYLICDYSDESLCALQHIRLCSRKLYNIATPVLFQRVGRYSHEDCRSRYVQILSNEKIRTYVLDLHINTVGDDDKEDINEREAFVNKKNLSLVRKFEQFPNLKAVTLRFSPNCSTEYNIYLSYPESINFRQNMLRDFVATLAKTSITDVSILNLQNVNDETLLVSEDFQSTISRLTSLTLQICTERADDDAPECATEMPELHTFFPALPRTWLHPASTTLTRLGLYSDHYFGWLPSVDLTSLLFPSLTSLALGRYTLAAPTAFLAWLTRHAATLRYLTLHDCPILVTRVVRAPLRLGPDGVSVSMTLPRTGGTGRGRPPLLAVQHEGVRWGDVFARLGGGEMAALREVRVSSVEWRHGARAAAREMVENLPIELSAGRYAWFDGGYERMRMWGGETRARLSEEGGEEWRGFVEGCGAGMDGVQDGEDVEAMGKMLERLGMREGRVAPVYLDRRGDGNETVVRFGG